MAIYGGLAVHSGINYFWERGLAIPVKGNSWAIRGIDNWAPLSLNKTTAHISDGTFFATALVAGVGVLYMRDKQWHVPNMLVQNCWLTMNLTQAAKLAFLRNRPYTYGNQMLPGKRDDHFSFFSGHTALTATMAATLWLERDRSSQAQTYMAIGATVFSATTAVLRVKAGKHFPTDVLVGAVIGVGTAWVHDRLAH